MILALDFDDTYTLDPALWQQVVKLFKAAGHRVICVTCRHDTPDNRLEVVVPGVDWREHYFTSMAPKRWHMELRGIKVDVWADDLPRCVDYGR